MEFDGFTGLHCCPMRRLRFSLRLLFVVATLAVLFLGYSQWRRQEIIRNFQEFEQVGAYVDIPASYVDYIWQRQPQVARVRLNRYDGKPRQFPNRDLNSEHRRLKEAGIVKFYWVASGGSGRYESPPFDRRILFDQRIPQLHSPPEMPIKIQPHPRKDAPLGGATLSERISQIEGPRGRDVTWGDMPTTKSRARSSRQIRKATAVAGC